MTSLYFISPSLTKAIPCDRDCSPSLFYHIFFMNISIHYFFPQLQAQYSVISWCYIKQQYPYWTLFFCSHTNIYGFGCCFCHKSWKILCGFFFFPTNAAIHPNCFLHSWLSDIRTQSAYMCLLPGNLTFPVRLKYLAFLPFASFTIRSQTSLFRLQECRSVSRIREKEARSLKPNNSKGSQWII